MGVTPEMVSELEQASAETPETQEQTQVAPVADPVEQFEYLLGGKPSKLPANAEFVLKQNGKMSNIPLSQMINAYREFTHLKPKFQQLTEAEKRLQAERGEYDTFKKSSQELEPFKKLQEWSMKRPEAFEFVMKHMKMDENGLLTMDGAQPTGAQNDGLNQMISSLREEITGLKTWKSQWEKSQEDAANSAEDQAVEKETEETVAYLKGKGIDIDLDEKDESGISLRGRIYKHGSDNGISSVKAAALSYLSDTLLDRAMARGRSEAVKGVKGDAKAGIISRTSTPQNGQSPIDPRRMTAEQRMKAALSEYSELETE